MKQTSIDAYNEIKDSLNQRQRLVYNALRRRGNMTGNELDKYLEDYSAHKRLSELAKKGVIFEQCVRTCHVSGKNCTEWGVNEPGPQLGLDL